MGYVLIPNMCEGALVQRKRGCFVEECSYRDSDVCLMDALYNSPGFYAISTGGYTHHDEELQETSLKNSVSSHFYTMQI